MRKISIIGAGNVGPTTAFLLGLKNVCDIILVDIKQGIAEGKALDMMHAREALNFSSTIIGTADYSMIKDSEIIIIAAGISRKPGMSRSDLFSINKEIVKQICTEIKLYAPDAIVIVVTNPVDLMCKVAYNELGIDSKKILGLSSLLDTTRLHFYMGHFGKNSSSKVIGSHDDNMIFIIKEIFEPAIKKIEDETKEAGARIVSLSGSSYYGPSACLLKMVQSILNDEKKEIPACVYNGRVFIGSPALLGIDGYQTIEPELTSEERILYEKSIERLELLYKQFNI